MKDPNDFIELLRQIMSRECKPIISEEEIDMSIREMAVFELVGLVGGLVWRKGVMLVGFSS